MRKLDYRVVRGEQDVLSGLGTNSILVLAEPGGGAGSRLPGNGNLLGAETVLVVLPKWHTRQSELREDWISEARLWDQSVPRSVLLAVAGAGEIVRVAKPSGWRGRPGIPTPTVTGSIQLMKNPKLTPIVTTAEGMLIGELKQGRRRIWVLADPDPIENHGIGKGDNLAFATGIVYALLAGKQGTLVFDETLHGFQHSAPSLLKFLLEFPFNLIALQIVAAMLLLMLASVGRFGAPETPDQILQAGKLGLISNSASLLDHAGHHAAILRRYISMVLQDTGRLLRAPRQLNEYELAAWLDRTAAARGIRSDCAAALRGSGAEREDVVSLFTRARTIHRWRKDILNGTSGRLGDH